MPQAFKHTGCGYFFQAFEYVYKNHLDDADWFLKADDDTYTIVENLRYLLQDKNSSEAIFFGHKFKPFVPQVFPCTLPSCINLSI